MTDQEKTEAPESSEESSHTTGGKIDASRMPFMAHLIELRSRLVKASIGLGVAFGICYPFHVQLLAFMVEPLKKVLPEGQRLIYTNLPEAFFTYLKLSFLAAVLLAFPWLLYQIWCFIAPGLYKKERKYAFGFVLSTSLLFLGGAIFGYQVVFPFGFKFFVGFESEMIQPLPALNQYFSFSVRLLFAFGAVFELPIVVFFLARMGLVDAPMLRKNRKWAILGTFIIAAMFTPPDVVTQVLMAGPLLILYEVSIFVAKAWTTRSKDEEPEEEPEEKKKEETEDKAE